MNEELLGKLKNAETDEERKQIIESDKENLTDMELEQVSGGSGRGCKHPSLGCPKR